MKNGLVIICLLGIMFHSPFVAAQDTLSRGERLDSSVVTAAYPVSKGNRYVVSTQMSGRIVSAVGENDVLKAVAFRPGISQGVEGTQAFFVRGSGIGGNRIELDGVPLYRSSHLLGLVSSFPSEMISQMSFTTGGFQPSSGNLTSSLTEISLKQDIAPRFGGSVSLSPYMEGVFLEAPIGSRFTARASFRISPALALANKIVSAYGEKGSSFAISDIGGKAYDAMASFVWTPLKGVNLNGFYFRTEDAFSYAYGKDAQDYSSQEEAFKLGASWDAGRWGNLSGMWYRSSSNAVHQERFIWGSVEGQERVALSMGGGSAETGVKLQYTLSLLNYFTLDVGWDYSSRKMEYESRQEVTGRSVDTGSEANTQYSLSAPFVQIGFKKEHWIDARASARYSHYKLGGQAYAQPLVYKDIDIHAISDFYVWGSRGIEVSFDKASQYYHTLEGLPSGWGQDLMVACDETFPAERMKQLYVGVFGTEQFDKTKSLSYYAGYYWRELDGLIGFKHASHVFGMRDNIDSEDIVPGSGWSRGVELSATFDSPRVSVEASYTYSNTHRHYPELNFGRPFRFRFDRPHMLKATGSYLFATHPAKKSGTMEHRANLSVDLSSGSLMTISQGYVETPYPGMPVLSEDRTGYQDFGQLNNFRLPLYFRVDAGYVFTWKWTRSELLLNASIFNILNRHNIYQYFYEDGKWRSLSILPIMPSLRVQFSF